MNQDFVKEVLYYQQLSPGIIALVLGIAFVLGAIHALSPGHGKSLMAAYLIGSKGKIRDAVILGVTITISHVFSVILVGVLALLITDFFWSEKLSLWLGLFSGVLIFGIGIWLFVTRLRAFKKGIIFQKIPNEKIPENPITTATVYPLAAAREFNSSIPIRPIEGNRTVSVHQNHSGHFHDHSDAHSHSHHHYDPNISLWSNISLGISGGIVPCPKAIVILLLAISLQRIVLGITIIVAFSFGLAAVLMTIGIVMVRASNLIKNRFEDKRIQLLPILGSFVIIGLGIFLTIRTAILM
ncbi:MAG: sulfite exporter TauE/SafE family protein [Calditrichia bacterium]